MVQGLLMNRKPEFLVDRMVYCPRIFPAKDTYVLNPCFVRITWFSGWTGKRDRTNTVFWLIQSLKAYYPVNHFCQSDVDFRAIVSAILIPSTALEMIPPA